MGALVFLGLCAAVYAWHNYAEYRKKQKTIEDREIAIIIAEINEALDAVKISRSPRRRIERMDFAILRATQAAQAFPHTGTFKKFLGKAFKMRTDLHNEIVQDNVRKLMDKARIAKTVTGKVNSATKALEVLKAALGNEYIDKDKVRKSAMAVQLFINQEQLKDYELKAERFEFKANYKKALDLYQDALFFLKKDDIDDSEQAKDIQRIEKKIEEMRERIAAPKVGEKK